MEESVVAKIQALSAADDSDDSVDDPRPGESELQKEMRKEVKCREKIAKYKEKYGVRHERVVYWSLKLVDQLIPQYKLNDTEDTLNEIMDYCRELGGSSYVRAVQSRAFNLFKQYKFKESLACFKEQEKMCGPSAMLYENLAHVNNSLGDYDEAAKYFTLANVLIEQSQTGKRGGVLLGLGLVKERQGKPEEALPILIQALEHYKKEVGSDDGGSIIAKAHMSVGQCYEILKKLPEAVSHIQQAVKIFQKTTEDSPLTANAHGVLGRLLLAQGKVDLAEPEVLRALELEVDKDAFHMDSVWKLLNMLKEITTGDTRRRTLLELQRLCRRYISPIQRARARIAGLSTTDASYDKGTAAVLYKTCGELIMLAGCYQKAVPLLEEAVAMLQTVQGFDCTGLIESCRSSIRFCADKADIELPPEPVAAA